MRFNKASSRLVCMISFVSVLIACSCVDKKSPDYSRSWIKNELVNQDSLYLKYQINDTLKIEMYVRQEGTEFGNAVYAAVLGDHWIFNEEKDMRFFGVLQGKSQEDSICRFKIRILKLNRDKTLILSNSYIPSDTIVLPINYIRFGDGSNVDFQ